jgi:hypothetical protein
MAAIIMVPLRKWAKHWKVPYRTALEWARLGKIEAKKSKYKVTVKRVETVNGYLINPLSDPHILGLL